MRHTRRLRILLLAPLLLAAAACGGDDPTPAADAADGGTEGVFVEGAAVPEVRVTPAESAAAAVRLREHTDSMRRAARLRAGLPAEDAVRPPPPAAAAAPTADEEFRRCMAQAEVAGGHTRALIEAACERRRQTRAGDGA